jgi:hypothetical protein
VNLNCVHIHPKYMEATDNYSQIRFRLATGVEIPRLVRRDSLKHVVPLGMVDIAETDNWLHFRNEDGLVMAVRTLGAEDYLPLGEQFKVTGEPLSLPKGLIGTTDRATVWTSEIKSGDVLVKLEAGRVYVTGVGVTGDHYERKKLPYTGPPKEFVIQPAMLAQITEKYTDCEIGENRLKVRGGRWTYVAFLGSTAKKTEEKE